MAAKVLIFTGGHHTSALSVASHLSSPAVRIIWFGHRHSIWGDRHDSAEYQEVVSKGIKFYDLKAGKFYHTWHPLKLLRIPLGFLQAWLLLVFLKLKYGRRLVGIVSFGGYLAVPTVIAGWFLGLPSITHEQTMVSGWANKLIGAFSKKVAVTWPESCRYYRPGKSEIVGLPIRPEVAKALAVPRVSHSPPCIFITGGKQGSHVINKCIFSSLPQLLSRYSLVHQTGSNSLYRDYETALQLRSGLPEKYSSRYEIQEYYPEKDLAEIYKRADIVISRAGAHTTYELALLGLPSVLIPIPWSSHDEQNTQARFLVRQGLAVILPQSRLSSSNLFSALEQAWTLSPQPLPLPLDGLARMVYLINREFKL